MDRLVSGGGVGLVVVSLGVTIIGDISDVTGVTVDVIVDVLAAAIGKNDVVRARSVAIAIAALLVACKQSIFFY